MCGAQALLARYSNTVLCALWAGSASRAGCMAVQLAQGLQGRGVLTRRGHRAVELLPGGLRCSLIQGAESGGGFRLAFRLRGTWGRNVGVEAEQIADGQRIAGRGAVIYSASNTSSGGRVGS